MNNKKKISISKKLPLFLTASFLSLNCYAQEQNSVEEEHDLGMPDLMAMPFEQVMALKIATSVNKKPQSVKDSAAAVFVISQEDIRRSGVTTIPDALRMAPGLQVAQIDANKWAISARGFNDRFSTKLLVMIDGRALYSPIFAGVFWHREDTPLEDVERIEVIRGAGAAMWGANAVNGVINIITKSAKDTQGALITAGSGNQEQAFGSVRYGGQVGEDFHYRLYGKGFKRNNNVTLATHQNAQDDWENYQAGFKTEWQLNAQDSLTTQGDIYHSRTGNMESFALSAPPFVLNNQDSPAVSKGGNLQTRWKHKISATSETTLQFYYKYDAASWMFITPFKPREQTLDVYFQHNFNWLDQHEVVWGLGYRYFEFAANDSPKISFSPPKRNLQLFSGFLQDEVTLLDELKLTLGARLEHNDFTGFEVQPNIRLLWKPDNKQSVWGAISRAVRTPSIVGEDVKNLSNPVPNPRLPTESLLNGSSDIVSETVLDYELGYRIQPTSRISFDLAAFYNQYNYLQAFEISPPQVVVNSGAAHLEIPLHIANKMKGETLGFELTSEWQPLERLKIKASYWFLKSSLHAANGFNFADPVSAETKNPQQQVHIRASLNLPNQIELDTMMRYVDSVPYYQVQNYVAFDMRLAWKPSKNVEFSLVGQNLFDNHHLEFSDTTSTIPKTEIQRSIFGKVALSF